MRYVATLSSCVAIVASLGLELRSEKKIITFSAWSHQSWNGETAVKVIFNNKNSEILTAQICGASWGEDTPAPSSVRGKGRHFHSLLSIIKGRADIFERTID